ncbi:MAG: hypothetical protein DME26_09640, partial [Verrucomicrobia bacterium]
AWSFFGDGATNSTLANPTFTYSNAGNYQAQLIVIDSLGSRTVANLPISAGNNKPAVSILQPPNGAIFDWGKALAYQLKVVDVEDGSTMSGGISCSNVIPAPLLGHNDHSHGQGQFAGCSGVFTAPVNTDSDADNLFLVLNASYTDRGAPNVAPLAATTSYVFQPRHKQAEFCTLNGTVATATTSDPSGGGLDIAGSTNGSYISLSPVNLTNINGINFRVASRAWGGRIETHLESPAGTLLSTANIPFSDGVYTNISAPLTDPGGTHTLYFVFLRNPGDPNLFVLNWFAPFGGSPRSLPGMIQAEDFDNGSEGVAYHDTEPANYGGEYRNTGVDLQSTSDTGGGYNVGWMAAGEWLKYSVNVTTPGRYTLSCRLSAVVDGGTFHIEFDGVDKTGSVSVPNTGGWQTWQTLSLDNIVLDAGPQIIRLVLDSAGPDYVANFNWLQATLTLSNNPPTVSLTAPPDRATFAVAENITLSANAADLDGSISKVDFFANGFSLGTSTIPPYGIAWTNPAAGNYLLTARATDNIGNATVSPVRTIKVINGEAPFTGLPQTVPGTIQAEDFDGGGEGVAYHDGDTSNNGGKYRNTAVDIESTSDIGGGYNVGWTGAGEWLKYSINAVVDGVYTLQARIASSGSAGTFHIEFDGVDKTGSLTSPDSGGWQSWWTLTKTAIGLRAGPHVMRLVMDTYGANSTVGNFNYITLTATSTNPPPVLAHRYSFNEAAGFSTVIDSVGGAHGTLLGDAALTGDGRLSLLGTNGYVDLPNGLISGLTNASFEAWVKWNGGANSQRIFDFGNNTGGENNQGAGLTYLMLTPKSSAGLLRFAISTSSTSGESAAVWTNALPVGQSTHVAVAYDFVAGTSILYLNGQRVATGLA